MWLKIFCSLCFLTNIALASVADTFTQVKNDPNALYQFFKQMPKGGELHYHLAGGVYAEDLIALANHDNICLDIKNKAVTFAQKTCAIPLHSLPKNTKL